MRFMRTKLEEELAALPEEERGRRLQQLWTDFRGSPFFDLVVAVLRDIERQAVETIRQRPTANLVGAAMALHVVDLLRRSFSAMASGPVEWADEEVDFGD